MASYNFANYGAIKVNGTTITEAKFNGTTFWFAGVTSASVGNVSFSSGGNSNFDYSHTFPTQLRPGSIRIRAYMSHTGAHNMISGSWINSEFKLYNGSTHLGSASNNHGHGAGGANDSYTIDKTINVSQPVTRIWYRHNLGFSVSHPGNSPTTTSGSGRLEITVS